MLMTLDPITRLPMDLPGTYLLWTLTNVPHDDLTSAPRPLTVGITDLHVPRNLFYKQHTRRSTG